MSYQGNVRDGGIRRQAIAGWSPIDINYDYFRPRPVPAPTLALTLPPTLASSFRTEYPGCREIAAVLILFLSHICADPYK